MGFSAQMGWVGGRGGLKLSAPKGSKCPCGKRAKATLMSALGGDAEVMTVCMTCGLICMEYRRRLRLDEHAAGVGLAPELRKWFTTDSGTSSNTIASVLVPGLKAAIADGADVPHDPEDFGRCYRLLKLVSNGVERLSEVVAVYPEWARLVAAWPELTALYEEELPSGRAPKLYARMKELTT